MLERARLDRQRDGEDGVAGLARDGEPPIDWTMLMQTERPIPVATPIGFVVKNGSKIRPTCSAGMPGPVSVTEKNMRPRTSMPVATRISFRSEPPSGSACAALMSRFRQT